MNSEYKKEWYQKNKTRLLLKARQYRADHIKKIQEYDRTRGKIRRLDPLYKEKHKQLSLIWRKENIEIINNQRREQRIKKNIIKKTPEELLIKARLRNKKYYHKNKDKIREKKKLNINNNLELKLKRRLRFRIWNALKGKYKHKKTVELLGCDIDFLKTHLESQFAPGMSWENYGKTGWHIDHIQPFASVDLTIPTNLETICHYSNLQPLWAKDNLIKGSKYEKKRS